MNYHSLSRFFSLSLMSSRSIHPVTNSRNFFFLKVEQYSFICIYILFSLPIHMWIDNWVIPISCFFVNNAAINMDMKTSIQYPYFNSLDIPDVEFPDHMVILILIFWGMSIMFSIADLPFYIPTNNGQGFLFLSLTHVILKEENNNNSHSNNVRIAFVQHNTRSSSQCS